MTFLTRWVFLFVFLSLGTFLFAQVADDSKTKEYQYGLYWYKQGQYLKAMAWFRKVIELSPGPAPGSPGINHWQTYQMLGNTYYFLGYKAEAAKVYELSLKDNPNNPPLVKLVASLKGSAAATPTVTPTPAYHDTPPEPAWIIPGADEEGANQIHDLPVSLLNNPK